MPTSVSGSLDPLVVAVDGKKLVKETTNADGISVNEKTVEVQKKRGKPFFTRVETNTIHVEAASSGGEPKVWEWELPQAEVTSSKGKIVLAIKGIANRVTVDGKPLTYKANEASWTPPAGKKAFAKTWVLELSANGKPGRLYNLKLAPGAGDSEPKRELASVGRIRMGLSPADFRLSQISVFQKDGGNTFSGHLAWAPYWFFSKAFGAGVELGVSYFKDAASAGFLVADYELLAGWRGETLGVELRGGAQSWFGFSGTSPVVGTTLSYFFSHPWSGVVDRLFIAYSYYMNSTDPAHLLRVGLGFSL